MAKKQIIVGALAVAVLFVLVGLAASLSKSGPRKPQAESTASGGYVASWPEALERSKSTGKPLIVSYGGPW